MIILDKSLIRHLEMGELKKAPPSLDTQGLINIFRLARPAIVVYIQ